MTPELDPLIALWRTHRRGLESTSAHLAELVSEMARLTMNKQRHEAMLKDLEPVIHRIEGGAQALSEAGQELAEERIGHARKDKAAPTGPTVPMASLVDTPAKPAPAKPAPSRPSPAAETPK